MLRTAASTIFGPLTLPAYIAEFGKLVPHLLGNTTAPPGPNPPDLIAKDHINGLEPPGPDRIQPGTKLGQVLQQPRPSYFVAAGESHQVNETVVNVTFFGANPRQTLRRGETFLAVEYQTASGAWMPVANDDSLSTRLYWEKKIVLADGTTADAAAAQGEQHEEEEAGFQIPKHLKKAFGVAERVSGRRVSPALLEECLAKGGVGHCTYADVSVPVGGGAKSRGLLPHVSHITISWRPAQHAVGQLHTGIYRIVYLGDGNVNGTVEGFSGASRPFRCVFE